VTSLDYSSSLVESAGLEMRTLMVFLMLVWKTMMVRHRLFLSDQTVFRSLFLCSWPWTWVQAQHSSLQQKSGKVSNFTQAIFGTVWWWVFFLTIRMMGEEDGKEKCGNIFSCWQSEKSRWSLSPAKAGR
jgi:hypothetical protein